MQSVIRKRWQNYSSLEITIILPTCVLKGVLKLNLFLCSENMNALLLSINPTCLTTFHFKRQMPHEQSRCTLLSCTFLKMTTSTHCLRHCKHIILPVNKPHMQTHSTDFNHKCQLISSGASTLHIQLLLRFAKNVRNSVLTGNHILVQALNSPAKTFI